MPEATLSNSTFAITLQAFLQDGWRDHGDHPDAVAARLAESLSLVETPADVGPFVRLLTHVHGEHLGQWQRGVDLLEAVARLPAYDGSDSTRGPVMRGKAMLRFAGGDAAALDGLSDEDATYALAVAADALAARGNIPAATAAFSQALARAPESLTKEQPATRALAVCGNNFSGVLEKLPELGPAEARTMVSAAATGLRYWKLAGTWLEEERAEYQLARCQLRARELDAGLASIDRCIAVCTRNGAPPFELFFGHAVRALLHRAKGEQAAFGESRRAALEQYVLIPADEQKWCKREHTELGE